MTGVTASIPRIQFSDALGAPMANGMLSTYISGSTTPADTYKDQAMATKNTNPILLDSTGSAVIWLDPTKLYKFTLKSPAGVTQAGWPVDNINGAGSISEILRAELVSSTGSSLVGFLRASVGAVLRTIQGKLSDTVSLLDFIPVSEHAAIYAGTSTYDCLAAMQAAIASVARGGAGGPAYVGGPRIKCPPGKYSFSGRIQIKETVILEGDTGYPSGASANPTTEFHFPAGSGGIVVHRYNTFGDGVASPTTTGGDGTIIRNISLTSTRGQAYSQFKPGIWVRARCLIENIIIDGFPGDGIMVLAGAGGGGTLEGNANNWAVQHARILANSGCGISIAGADANAGYTLGVDVTSNLLWGIWDSSFLGNNHYSPHAAGNLSGAYKCDGSSNRTTIFGGYSEGGQPTSVIDLPSMTVGGIHAAGLSGSGNFYNGENPGNAPTMGSVRIDEYTAGLTKRFATKIGTTTGVPFSITAMNPDKTNVGYEYGYYYTESNNTWAFATGAGQVNLVFGDLTNTLGWARGDTWVPSLRLGNTYTATFRFLQLSAMPTSGTYTAGETVINSAPAEAGTSGSKYIITGWKRMVTGSSHVLNTDWVQMRALTGN